MQYEFENIKTGERIILERKTGNTKPPKGYVRVWDNNNILHGPNGTVKGF